MLFTLMRDKNEIAGSPLTYPGKIKRRPPTELRLYSFSRRASPFMVAETSGYPVSLRRSGRVAEGGALLRR